MTKNSEVTERLTSAETGMHPWLWLPLMRLIAQGDPVDLKDLTKATGRSTEEVRAAVEAMADTEYDGSGRIIGQGLTQRQTQHRFEVDGEQLYTWCALDTLIFPTLLQAPASIESRYGRNRTPVRLRVDDRGVRDVEPSTAVVSLVNPDDMSSIRSSFCNQVHFFASTEEAQPWLESHPGATVMPVADAYELASAMARRMVEDCREDGQPAEASSPFPACNC